MKWYWAQFVRRDSDLEVCDVQDVFVAASTRRIATKWAKRYCVKVNGGKWKTRHCLRA